MIAFLTETRTRVFMLAAAGICSAAAVATLLGLRLCLTPSLPLGVYETVDGPVRPGVVVTFCLPQPAATLAAARGYVARGRPLADGCADGTEQLGKQVAAVHGDTVTVADTGLAVNGHQLANTARLPRDSYGRPLPLYPAGTYVVHAGELWLVATVNRRSFDSRYFGPVPETNVTSVVRPLLTWQPGALLPAFRPECVSTNAEPKGGR